MGAGEPSHAAAFRVLASWDGPLRADPEGAAFRAVSMRRTSLWRLLRPSLLAQALRARREGHRQRGVWGDPWQLGGTVVVAPGDRVLYAHRNATPHDEASLDAVLEALRGASP